MDEPSSFLEAAVDCLQAELRANRTYGRHESIYVTAGRLLGDDTDVTPEELVAAWKSAMRHAYSNK